MRFKALSALAAAALTTSLAHAAPVRHDAIPTGLEPAADPVCCPARSFLHEIVPAPDDDKTPPPDPESISEFSPPPSTPLTTDLPPFVAPPCGVTFLPAYDISGDAVGSVGGGGHHAPTPSFSPHAATAMIIPPIVPEPASATLLTLGGIALMHRRRVLRE